MYWKDEGYLLSKKNLSENSIIIEAFTENHGKYSGIVYGGSSRKQKKNYQIGNKILLNCKSKGVNKVGYFSIELITPVSPPFFDDKERSICILSATTILKLLLPERQINKKIYNSFQNFLIKLNNDNWIELYILWELELIKELGFAYDFKSNSKSIEINGKLLKVPEKILKGEDCNYSTQDINDALIFNKNLLIENFILPNKLRFPISRNILEKYFIN